MISNCSLFTFNRFLYQMNRFLVLFLCLLVLSAVFLFIFFSGKSSLPVSLSIKQPQTVDTDYSRIGEGVLFPKSSSLSPLALEIKKELLFLCFYMDEKAVIGWKNAKQRKVISLRDPLYVEYRTDAHTQKRELCLSVKSTPFVVHLKKKQGSALSAEVVENEKTTGSFTVSKTGALSKKEADILSQKSSFQSLQQSKAWGGDKLIQHYGGNAFKEKKKRNKIQIEDANGSYFLYLQEGDILIWKDGRWSLAFSDRLHPSTLFAKVFTMTSHLLEIGIWDEGGFSSSSIKIYFQPQVRLQMRFEEIFSSVRLKTASQVSCLLGKKRVLMKKGDWWIKRGSSWHSIKTFDEIQKILDHTLQGELFVFDGIEKNQGKAYIKGHFFDTMRTSIQPVSFPIAEKKKSLKTARSSGEKTVRPTSKSFDDRREHFKDPSIVDEDNSERATLP